MPDLGDRTTLKNSFDTRINNNTSEDITPTDVRESLDDTVDTIGAEIDSLGADLTAAMNDATNIVADTQTKNVFRFSTDTDDDDPTNGFIKFNSGTIGSVTFLYVDDLDLSGVNRAAEIATWGGQVAFNVLNERTSAGVWTNPTANRVVFRITGITDASGYTKVAVVYVSGALPANDSLLSLSNVGSTLLTGAIHFAGAGTDEVNGDWYEVSEGLWSNDDELTAMSWSSGSSRWIVTYDGDSKYVGTGGTELGGPLSSTAWALGDSGVAPPPTVTPAVVSELQELLDLKANTVDVPTVYRAVAAGTTVTYAVNQFGVAFTIASPGNGEYNIQANSGTPFTANKTFAWVTCAVSGVSVFGTVEYVDNTRINFFFFDDTGAVADPATYQICIETYQ